MRAGRLLATATLVLAGCSGADHQATRGPGARGGSTSSAVATTRVAPFSSSTSASTSPVCSDRSVVDSWSPARRAAVLLAVPALGADPAVVQAAVAAGAGGVLLIGSLPGSARLTADLRPTRGHQMLVMVDQEGGGVQRLGADVTPLPWPRQMAATMSTATVQQLATRLAGQMSPLGVNADLAPVLDLDAGETLSAQDPDGPRSFSPDPAVAAAYGEAFATGLQRGGVLSVVKHFPGLGGATGNTDYGPASTPPVAALEGAGLVSFERAVKAGVKAVMVANAKVPGLSTRPASVSPEVVTGLLRGRLGFGGLVVTDSLSAGAISAAGLSLPAAVVAAVEAGVDMVLWGSTLTPADTAQLAPAPVAAETKAIITAVVGAVADRSLPVSRLDDAVLHVLQARGIHPCGSG